MCTAHDAEKFIVWARVIDGLQLAGEVVLDIGCGRGAVLILAAQRLQSGRAVGVDLWRKGDQSGNGAAATMRNAGLARVAEHVSVETADMTALPFGDGSFDVVFSSLAIHNVRKRDGRVAAIARQYAYSARAVVRWLPIFARRSNTSGGSMRSG